MNGEVTGSAFADCVGGGKFRCRKDLTGGGGPRPGPPPMEEEGLLHYKEWEHTPESPVPDAACTRERRLPPHKSSRQLKRKVKCLTLTFYL